MRRRCDGSEERVEGTAKIGKGEMILNDDDWPGIRSEVPYKNIYRRTCSNCDSGIQCTRRVCNWNDDLNKSVFK